MPLLKGKKNIGNNIRIEEAAGKPHAQAIAIALHVAHIPMRNKPHHNRIVQRKKY